VVGELEFPGSGDIMPTGDFFDSLRILPANEHVMCSRKTSSQRASVRAGIALGLGFGLVMGVSGTATAQRLQPDLRSSVPSSHATRHNLSRESQVQFFAVPPGIENGPFGPGDAAWTNYYAAPSNTSTWGPYCAGGGGSVVQSADGVPACGPTGTTTIELPSPSNLTIETPGFQCVELSDRFLYVHDGLLAQPANGDQVVAEYGAKFSIPIVANGTANNAPQTSDVISFSANSNFQDSDGGHVAVVVGSTVGSSGNGTISVLDENDNDTAGLRSIAVDDWVVQPYGSYTYIEWLELSSFVPAPSVGSISPDSGPAGTSVTISGNNFTDASAVHFGSASASFSVTNSTTIAATAPSGTGTVNVTVTTPAGTSAVSSADQFKYPVPPPTVTAVRPTSGPTKGGTKVTITGTNLTGVTAVRFGSTSALSFKTSAAGIRAVSPAGTGTVNVTVVTATGTSPVNPDDQFTYVAKKKK